MNYPVLSLFGMNFIKDLTHWYVSKRAVPYWTVLILDWLIIIFSGLCAYALVRDVATLIYNFPLLIGTLLSYSVVFLVAFKVFHTYTGILRYSSFVDLKKVAFAVVTGTLVVFVLQFAFNLQHWLIYLSPTTLLFSASIAVVLMATMRIWAKMLYESYFRRNRTERAFIYGTKAGGVSIAKSVNSSADTPYRLLGFVSDDPEYFGKRLMDLPIHPNDDKLISLMHSMDVKTLIVSPLKIQRLQENVQFVDNLADAGIKMMVTPNAVEWDGKSELKSSELRAINAEDLLPRHKIEVDMKTIGNLLRGKRILITGAAGSIGSEMVRQVARFGPEQLILVDQAETPLHDVRLEMATDWAELDARTIVADIANEERMRAIFEEFRPQYVFHAAAYKHVPMMEDNPAESIVNNVKGTKIVADLAVETGVDKFVMVSTDKAVNPTNVMGCSKRICEIYVQSLDKAEKDGKIQGKTQFVTTRFGNVLGSNGSVIPLFLKQIKNGGPVTVTHPDIIRFFMLINEACKLVLEAGTMGHGGEIFVFDMGAPVKIVDLARRMIRLSGAKDVQIKFTGLRDGEKLYEEVLNDRELTKPTIHPQIMIATVREYDFRKVSDIIDEMIANAATDDAMEVVRRMKRLVPEFKSRHSVYEAIDKEEADKQNI